MFGANLAEYGFWTHLWGMVCIHNRRGFDTGHFRYE